MNKNIVIAFLIVLNFSLLAYHYFNNQNPVILNNDQSKSHNFSTIDQLFKYATNNSELSSDVRFVVYLDDRSCLMCFRNEIENLKTNDLSKYSLILFFSSSSSELTGLENYKIIDVSKEKIFTNLSFTNPISFTIENSHEVNYLKILNPTSRYVYDNNDEYYSMLKKHLDDQSN